MMPYLYEQIEMDLAIAEAENFLTILELELYKNGQPFIYPCK